MKINLKIFRSPSTWAFLLMGLGIVMIIGLLCIEPFSFKSWARDKAIDEDLAAKFGTLVSGILIPIFSVASGLLLYDTIILQRKLLEKQDYQLLIQQEKNNIDQFENTFFKLFDIYEKIKDQVEIRIDVNQYTKPAITEIFSKDDALRMIYDRIKTTLAHKKSMTDSQKKILDKERLDVIRFLYLANYLGTDSKDYVIEYLNKISKNNHNVNSSINYFFEIYGRMNSTHRIKTNESHLSNYFNILLLILETIQNEDSKINKQKYLNIIKHQLTQYECIILLIHSIVWRDKWIETSYVKALDLGNIVGERYLDSIFIEKKDIEK